jgi:hypothetical protein
MSASGEHGQHVASRSSQLNCFGQGCFGPIRPSPQSNEDDCPCKSAQPHLHCREWTFQKETGHAQWLARNASLICQSWPAWLKLITIRHLVQTNNVTVLPTRGPTNTKIVVASQLLQHYLAARHFTQMGSLLACK